MNYQLLSHPLSEATVGFGGGRGFERKEASSIKCGKSSNSEFWAFPNHLGTHIDGPRHFSEVGDTIDSLEPAEWFFTNPYLATIALQEDELLQEGDWLTATPKSADILLLKSGFERFRGRKAYWNNNPGLSPSVGIWLRAHRPNLRAIGFDFISLTAFQHREIGRIAHREFLDPAKEGKPIMIVEDMKLSGIVVSPRQLIIAPLLVENSDGSPVTIFAEKGER